MANTFICCLGKHVAKVVPVVNESSLISVTNESQQISEKEEKESALISKMAKVENSHGNVAATGHFLKKKTFHKPTYCHHCSDLLWGLTNQGMYCTGMYLFILHYCFYSKLKNLIFLCL